MCWWSPDHQSPLLTTRLLLALKTCTHNTPPHRTAAPDAMLHAWLATRGKAFCVEMGPPAANKVKLRCDCSTAVQRLSSCSKHTVVVQHCGTATAPSSASVAASPQRPVLGRLAACEAQRAFRQRWLLKGNAERLGARCISCGAALLHILLDLRTGRGMGDGMVWVPAERMHVDAYVQACSCSGCVEPRSAVSRWGWQSNIQTHVFMCAAG